MEDTRRSLSEVKKKSESFLWKIIDFLNDMTKPKKGHNKYHW